MSPRGEVEVWRDAFEELYCLTVIPRRSVDRIRRALAEGRDPEPYLRDAEEGLQAVAELAIRMDDRPAACPTCHGTGTALADTAKEDAR